MEYEHIAYSQEDSIGIITLNEPKKLNPLSLETCYEVIDVINKVEHDNGIKVLIIRGAGRAFSAGGDVGPMIEFAKKVPGDLQERLHKAHMMAVRLTKLEKIVLAQIHGLAYGAGLDLTLSCDLRIASSDAKFCEAYLKVGLSPGMGALYMLPRYVGLGRALKLILTSEAIDAAEAERIGLVDIVVPPEKLEETTMDLARRFANGPSKGLGVTKKAIFRGLSSNFEMEQCWTSYEQTNQFLGKDTQEGMKSFLEKREPKFKGEY